MSGADRLADGLYEVPAGRLACVVTSLEMRAPPARPPPAARPGLAVRLVRDPQPDWYRDLFRRIGTPWLWFSRLRLSDAALADLIADPAVEITVLADDHGDQGLIELDFRSEAECEIAFFGLVPALTGRGIGPWFMDHALRRAWRRDVERVWLHTCTLDHPASLAFYQRSGFVPFRQQVEVADDPRRLGVLPDDAAPHVPML